MRIPCNGQQILIIELSAKVSNKYIHWIQFKDGDELYDLETDPNEISNLI